MEKRATSYTFRRGLAVPNRLVIAPMTTKMSFYDGVVTTDERNYYAAHTGTVGLYITAAANVQPDGKGWEGELGVHDDAQVPGLHQLANTIQQGSTKGILQLFHGGRMTTKAVLGGQQTVAPSAVAAERPGAETPRALEQEEIESLFTNFKAATRRAIAAGFSGVELHGANTYLLQQFFSPHSNRRDDEWGGSREKRFRFIERLVREVTEVVDHEAREPFIVGYRFSPEEFEEPGIQFSDTLWLVDQLAKMPLDYLHISLNDYAKKPQTQAPEPTVSMLKSVHEVIAGRLPLIGVGSISNTADVEHVLQQAEFAAVGRAVLIDPEWPLKILVGNDEAIVKNLAESNRQALHISNGVWEFLRFMMPERLIK